MDLTPNTLKCPHCGSANIRNDVGMENEEEGCPRKVCADCHQNSRVVRWEHPETAELMVSPAKDSEIPPHPRY